MDPHGHNICEPRLVKSLDGTEICADAAGNRAPKCPVIVLIHGFSVRKEAFDPMFKDPNWVQNAFLVRYDTRGHGESGKPTSDEAWESRRMSEDFEAVCKEFGVQKTFVLGWSLGAAFFVDILTYNKSVEISGLINVAGAPYIDPTAIARVASPRTLRLLETLANPTSVGQFQKTALHFIRSCSNVMSQDLYRVLLEGIILQPREVTGKLITRKQDPVRFLQDARDGKVDVLVVGGGKDEVVEAEGLMLIYKELGWKKCTLKRLDEADHIPWISAAETFRDTVLGWVKERHSSTIGPRL